MDTDQELGKIEWDLMRIRVRLIELLGDRCPLSPEWRLLSLAGDLLTERRQAMQRAVEVAPVALGT